MPRRIGKTERKFDFGELPPTFNDMLRWHWTKRAAQKNRWIILLKQKLGANYHCPEPCEIIVLWKVMREQDDDNCSARFKFVGDALKRAGYISDDKPSVLHLPKPSQMTVPHLSEQGFSMLIRSCEGYQE